MSQVLSDAVRQISGSRFSQTAPCQLLVILMQQLGVMLQMGYISMEVFPLAMPWTTCISTAGRQGTVGLVRLSRRMIFCYFFFVTHGVTLIHIIIGSHRHICGL